VGPKAKHLPYLRLGIFNQLTDSIVA